MARQPRPLEEWLDQPHNRRMFERISDEMMSKISLGEFNRPGTRQLDPDAAEAWRNQQKLSLTEQLIQEAPDEYLSEWELECRHGQDESA